NSSLTLSSSLAFSLLQPPPPLPPLFPYTTLFRSHPFKRYLDQGVVVTLNTDGRVVDGISLTDEYFVAQSVLGLTKADLARVVLNACESAFLPEFEKVALVSRVQSELEAL